MLNWSILSIGGVASGRVCAYSLCSSLVINILDVHFILNRGTLRVLYLERNTYVLNNYNFINSQAQSTHTFLVVEVYH